MRPLLFVVLLAVLLLAPPLHAKEAETGAAPQAEPTVTGRFEDVDGRRVLTLWGTPRERGFAHGYLMAERILKGLEHDLGGVLKPMLPLYKTLVRNVIVPRFHFSDDENAELEGLMAGIRARLPKEKLTLASLGREVELVDLKALNTFGDWYGLGCSSVAVWGELTKDGQPLVGRNFDFPGFELIIGQQVIVVRAPLADRQGQAGVSYPGCIGTLTGMNTAGVFVAIHDVRVKRFDKAMRANVPRLIALRRILERASGAEACLQARDFVRSWPTLYGNNLMVVAPARAANTPCAAVLEYDCRDEIDGGCSMRCVDAAEGDDAPVACLACTNHHRARPEPPLVGARALLPRWRYDILSRLGGENRPAQPFDVAGMFAWMTKAAYPREGKPQQRAASIRGASRHHGTLHQVVGEPSLQRLHVKLGAIGKHISEIEAHPLDVPALVKAAAAKQAVVTKPREPAGAK